MNKVFKVSLIYFLLTTSVYAQTTTEVTCPKARAIVAIGVNYAYVDNIDHSWISGWKPSHNYGTTEKWEFSLGSPDIHAENEAAAMALATKGLKSLVLFSGPIQSGNEFTCYYTTDEGILGYAYTNPYVK